VRRNLDIALFLRCCPHCLGDLEYRSDVSGEYYTCLQCNERADAAARLGQLARIASRERTRVPLRGFVAG
jgi:hypothetical protein